MRSTIYDTVTLNEAGGWLGKLVGKKAQPVQFLDRTPTKITLKVGGVTYVLTRTSDIANPRTKQFSYIWTAKTASGRPNNHSSN